MKKYLNTADSDWYKQRLPAVVLIVTAGFGVLLARLFFLQIIEGGELRRLSETNCIRLQDIDPPRGLIFDCNGEILVDNRPSFDLSLVLKDARPLEKTVEKLAQYTGWSQDEIFDKIERNKTPYSYKPVLLRQDIGRDMLAAIEVRKFDLPGIVIDVRTRRHYIREKSAAHLLGYLGEINARELESETYSDYRGGDLIGKFGVEKSYEEFLRGTVGGRQVEVNANGRVVRVLNTVDARPGQNIFLTIDRKLQEKAEQLLQQRAGAVVAMEVDTGKVLALASYPPFDQNDFVSGLSHEKWRELISNPLRPMENKAIQAEYPPASTYKIITAAAGLEEGVIDQNTAMYCPGFYRFGDRDFRCWKRGGHGTVNVVRALAESCDVYFYQVGLKLGIDRLAWYAKAFGLGARTGIDLDHESEGLVPTAAWKRKRTGVPWQRGETLSVAIGQGYNLATPLQMAVLTSAVANGGVLYRPQILARVETAGGEIVLDNEKEVAGQLPVSQKTLGIVKKGLWEVVNGSRGTARIAKLEDCEICGKTGTAQIVGRKKNENVKDSDREKHHRAHAWFVAYAPSEKPEIAAAIIVEHGEHGSSAASPIARDLFATYFELETKQ